MDTSQNAPEAALDAANDQASDSTESRLETGPAQTSDETPQVTSLWESVKAELSKSLSAQDFDAWIKPIQAHRQGSELILTTPHRFFFNWIKDYYLDSVRAIIQSLRQAADPPGSVEELEPVLAVAEAPPEELEKPKESSLVVVPAIVRPAQRSIWPTEGPLRINPEFTFENFVPGDPNRLAYEAARAFAREEKLGVDILFIYSAHGLGKTHLVQALAQAYLATRPDKRVFYLAAEHYTNDYVKSLKTQQMDDFKLRYRYVCDFFLVEEFSFLCGKPRFQEEFNHTLDLLLNHGKKIVLTSTQDFQSLTRLCPQLRSKIGAALKTPRNPPDFDTRIAILAHKSRLAGLKLDRPVLNLLAENLKDDVRLLEGCLMSISANSRLLRRPVNIELARHCLAFVQASAADDLSSERIIRIVCQNFHVGEADVASISRKQRVKEARALAMYLLRNLTNKTLAEIGSCFQRTHSTTLNAIHRIESRLKKDQKLKDEVDFLTGQLVK
jgi:chromosomal replication initiator protein